VLIVDAFFPSREELTVGMSFVATKRGSLNFNLDSALLWIHPELNISGQGQSYSIIPDPFKAD
jgi:hypothetical protein